MTTAKFPSPRPRKPIDAGLTDSSIQFEVAQDGCRRHHQRAIVMVFVFYE